jgi:hypothetical protein
LTYSSGLSPTSDSVAEESELVEDDDDELDEIKQV